MTPGCPSRPGPIETRAEVCVIGGGLIGTSVAYHATKLGLSVILLDQAGLASGASGASFGWVCAHFASYMPEYPRFHMRFMRAGLDAFDRIADDLGPEIEYRRTGGMSLIYSEQQWRSAAALAATLTEEGIPAEVIDRRETIRREPALSGDFLGALASGREGLVNPLALVRACARGARRRDSHICTGVRVAAILACAGDFRIETSHGPLTAEQVVNAAGIGAPEIGRMVGLEIPVSPNRGQQLILEGGPPAVRSAVHGRGMVRQTDAGTCIVGGCARRWASTRASPRPRCACSPEKPRP
jgi:sarcosine oxidase subunit beta